MSKNPKPVVERRFAADWPYYTKKLARMDLTYRFLGALR